MNAGGLVHRPLSSSMTSTQQPKATSRRAQLALACIVIVAAIAIATTAMSSCIDDGTMLCSNGLRCPPGSTCTLDGDQCTKTGCGDGHMDPDAGEGCDDGNLKYGDGCSGDCVSTERCGNGHTDRQIGEECDDGMSLNNELGTCGRDCQLNCGNGVLDPMEECDGSFFRDSCLNSNYDRGPLTCSSGCEPRSERCARIGWERAERPVDTDNLQGVWGDASKQIYAVGQLASGDGQMAVLHFDGEKWVDAKPPIGSGRLLEVWGSGPRDVFVVGEVGRVLYYDGTWLQLLSGVRATLSDVWGSGPQGDVFAVGDDRTIVRFARSTRRWQVEEVPSSVAEATALEAVWGKDQTDIEDEIDVYAVGHAGTILHRTEDGWTHEAAGLTDADLFDVWGTDDGEMFAAGEGGIILHRVAGDWSIMDTSSETTLHGLWGSSANQVFAVGERGTVIFYDGRTWSPLESGTDVTLTAVRGVPGYGIVAVAQSGLILRYAGWSWIPEPAQPAGGAIRSLWARGLDDVYTLTENTLYPQRFDGETWSVMDEGFASLACVKGSAADGTSPLRHLWGSDDGNLYVAGDDRIILRYVPAQGWTCMDIEPPQAINVHRIWGVEDARFAVGEVVGEGRGIVLIHETTDQGQSWRELVRTDAPLRGIWGETPNELFAVGDEGTLLHYKAAEPPSRKWQRIFSDTRERLNAIWGSSMTNIHVVGENGETLQFDGTRWSKSTVNSNEHLLDLWGSRSGHVFAVGSNGAMFHRQGRDHWGRMRANTDLNLTAVRGLETPLGNPRGVMFGGEGETFRRFLVNEDVLFGY